MDRPSRPPPPLPRATVPPPAAERSAVQLVSVDERSATTTTGLRLQIRRRGLLRRWRPARPELALALLRLRLQRLLLALHPLLQRLLLRVSGGELRGETCGRLQTMQTIRCGLLSRRSSARALHGRGGAAGARRGARVEGAGIHRPPRRRLHRFGRPEPELCPAQVWVLAVDR